MTSTELHKLYSENKEFQLAFNQLSQCKLFNDANNIIDKLIKLHAKYVDINYDYISNNGRKLTDFRNLMMKMVFKSDFSLSSNDFNTIQYEIQTTKFGVYIEKIYKTYYIFKDDLTDEILPTSYGQIMDYDLAWVMCENIIKERLTIDEFINIRNSNMISERENRAKQAQKLSIKKFGDTTYIHRTDDIHITINKKFKDSDWRIYDHKKRQYLDYENRSLKLMRYYLYMTYYFNK